MAGIPLTCTSMSLLYGTVGLLTLPQEVTSVVEQFEFFIASENKRLIWWERLTIRLLIYSNISLETCLTDRCYDLFGCCPQVAWNPVGYPHEQQEPVTDSLNPESCGTAALHACVQPQLSSNWKHSIKPHSHILWCTEVINIDTRVRFTLACLFDRECWGRVLCLLHSSDMLEVKRVQRSWPL